jgi:hypothetical protein
MCHQLLRAIGVIPIDLHRWAASATDAAALWSMREPPRAVDCSAVSYRYGALGGATGVCLSRCLSTKVRDAATWPGSFSTTSA